jgi:hypothetical protein
VSSFVGGGVLGVGGGGGVRVEWGWVGG